jgi:hypothetical protein
MLMRVAQASCMSQYWIISLRTARVCVFVFSFVLRICLDLYALQLRVSSESEFSDDEDLNNALAALNNRRSANALPNNGAVDDSVSAAADVGVVSEAGPALVSGSGSSLGPSADPSPGLGPDPATASESWPTSAPSTVPLMRAATSDQSNSRRPVFQPAKAAAPKTVADLARLAVEPAAVVFDFGWLDDMHENDEDFDKVEFFCFCILSFSWIATGRFHSSFSLFLLLAASPS